MFFFQMTTPQHPASSDKVSKNSTPDVQTQPETHRRERTH